MKKSAILLVIMLCASVLFASSELFIKTSDEVVLLESLVRESGKVMPQVIYPVSGDYLASVIEDMDLVNQLPEYEQDALNNLLERFKGSNLHGVSEDFKFDADIFLSPVVYYNYGKDNESFFTDRVVPFNEMPPFLKGTADLYLTKYAFGHMEYEYSGRINRLLKDGLVMNVCVRNMTIPYNTYLGAGTEHFNIFAGRVRVSSGNGVTGNLAVGDNFMYRNTIKLGLYTKPFTYEFLINTFDSELKEKQVNPVGAKEALPSYQPSLDRARPLVMLHKATYSFNDKVSVGLYEAMMDYSSASAFDPKIANPFLLMHNLLSYRCSTNNFFGAETDVALGKGLVLHGQLFFDQINLKGEDGKGEPSAYGFLVNVKYTGMLKGNRFNSYAEFAYTNPWAYLKPEEYVYWFDEWKKSYSYRNQDLVVGNYQDENGFDTGYLGYKYGPNCVVLALGADYTLKNNRIAADLLLKASGDTGYLYETDMAKGDDARTRKAVSPFCYDKNHDKQYLIRLVLSDEFKLKGDAVTVNAVCGLQKYINYKCEKGKDKFNAQFTLGVTVKPLDLFKK